MQYPNEKLDKPQTDDGEFRRLPKEVKQHIFSFLRGSPIVSRICKNFNELNEKFKPRIYLIGFDIDCLKDSTPSLRSNEHQICLFHKVNSIEKAQYDFLFKKLRGYSEFSKDGSIDMVNNKNSELASELQNFKDYINSSSLNKLPYFCFYVKKELLYNFFKKLEELSIKTKDCKIINKPFGLKFDELVQGVNEFVSKIRSIT